MARQEAVATCHRDRADGSEVTRRSRAPHPGSGATPRLTPAAVQRPRGVWRRQRPATPRLPPLTILGGRERPSDRTARATRPHDQTVTLRPARHRAVTNTGHATTVFRARSSPQLWRSGSAASATPARRRPGIRSRSIFCWSCAAASWRPRPSTTPDQARPGVGPLHMPACSARLGRGAGRGVPAPDPNRRRRPPSPPHVGPSGGRGSIVGVTGRGLRWDADRATIQIQWESFGTTGKRDCS